MITPPKETRSDSLIIGNGRILPNLIIVTSSSKLARNIGTVETNQILQAIINDTNLQLIDLPIDANTAEQAALALRPHLQNSKLVGVVILGGYDVVPALRLDVLDIALRQRLIQTKDIIQDQDNFIVWSDDIYGDRDGDFLPELPVSRIPDGHSAAVVISALQTQNFSPNQRFGIRNLNRPFADSIFPLLPGSVGNLEVSATFGPAHILPNSPRGAVYYMLHGSNLDGTRYSGELADTSGFDAITIANIPKSTPGTIVLTGCCWGALTVSTPAVLAQPGTIVKSRGPETSIPIAYLLAGAQAFVGCTGSHYSPNIPPYNNGGKPMHEAFWKNIRNGIPPAKALFMAKKDYIRDMPNRTSDSDPFGQAAELKTFHQFTCLGFGW
ncbi:hypothetical protein [Spirosoma arcticum]